LGKEFTRDELYQIAEVVGVGEYVSTFSDSEDICFIIEYYCPECVNYINYIAINYVVSFSTIVGMLMISPFSIYYNWFETASIWDIMKLAKMLGKSKEWVIDTSEDIGQFARIYEIIYILYIIFINLNVFREIYRAYVNRKIINKLGRPVRKVTKNTKLKIRESA